MIHLWLWLRNGLRREEGQDLAEYALLIGLVAFVVVAAVTLLGNQVSVFFGRAGAAVSAWGFGGT